MKTAVNIDDTNSVNRYTTGVVIWFNEVLEFGFIRHPDVKEDVFFHRKSLKSGTREHWLTSGREVSFILKLNSDNPDDRGPRALDVSVIPGDAS